MKKFLQFSLPLLALLPLGASAATSSITGLKLEDLITILGPIVIRITQILDALALLAFFWGVAMFIWNASDEKKRAQGRQVMIWGIIALFLLASLSGLIHLLQVTFGLTDNPAIVPPSATPPFSI